MSSRGLVRCSLPSCAVEDARLLCSACRVVLYDSPACQRADWPRHRAACRAAVAAREAVFARVGVAETAPLPPDEPARRALFEALFATTLTLDVLGAALGQASSSMRTQCVAIATSALAPAIIAQWAADSSAASAAAPATKSSERLRSLVQCLAMSDDAVVPLLRAGALRASILGISHHNAGRRHAATFMLWRALMVGRVDIVAAGAVAALVDCIRDKREFGVSYQAIQIAKDLVVSDKIEIVTMDGLTAQMAQQPHYRDNARALLAAGCLAPTITALCAGMHDEEASMQAGETPTLLLAAALACAGDSRTRTEVVLACRNSVAFIANVVVAWLSDDET
jgi:hypothetical protein